MCRDHVWNTFEMDEKSEIRDDTKKLVVVTSGTLRLELDACLLLMSYCSTAFEPSKSISMVLAPGAWCVCVCVCVQTDTPPLEDAKRLLCCTEGYRHFGIRRMLNTSHTVS
jgi:hypothetical protein